MLVPKMRLYNLFLYCFLLLWRPQSVLAAPPPVVNLETDIKFWIDPRCEEDYVYSFNEARHVAKLMWEELGKEPDEISKPLNTALKRYFNFETTDRDSVSKMRCKHTARWHCLLALLP